MKLIGTDISIAECRSSGYPVVHATTKNLDPCERYRVTVSNPRAWGKRLRRSARYQHDVCLSYEFLWKRFISEGQPIKDFCDFDSCPYPSPDEGPSFDDMASLFGTVSLYCGIE